MNHYRPDIVLLQEIDEDQLPNWYDAIRGIGLKPKFFTVEGRRHGLIIAYSWRFRTLNSQIVHYAHEPLPGFSNRRETDNCGMIFALAFNNDSNVTRGIVVCTTHLSWNPNLHFERAIQCGQLLQNALAMANDMELETNTEWPIIIGGDFNCAPHEPMYKLLFGEPFHYLEFAQSLKHLYHRWGFVKNGIEPVTRSTYDVDTDIRREGTDDPDLTNRYVKLCVNALLPLYNLDGRSVCSLYASHLNREPHFTTWGADCKETVDYLFVIERGDTVALRELLDLPKFYEMPEKGMPQEDWYPSDHLALMAGLFLEV